MRDFNDTAREKKSTRIELPVNPDRLSEEMLARLEADIKASLRDGYLPCPASWRIAREAGVTKIAVGEACDRLGIRVTDCQIGFFKKSKTPYENTSRENIDEGAVSELKQLGGRLTCAGIFDLAQKYKVKPITLSHEAGALGLKIRECQLGCF